MKTKNNLWEPEEIKTLRGLLSTHSNGQIAEHLPGRTRCAVSGMINRLKKKGLLPSHLVKHYDVAPHGNKKPSTKGKPKRKAKPEPPPAPKPEPPKTKVFLDDSVVVAAAEDETLMRQLARMVAGGVTLLELDSTTCRWPVRDNERGVAVLFCGHTPLDGRPYCSHHCAKAFVQGKVPTHA